MSLLEVKDLSVSFDTRRGRVQVLDKVSLNVEPGETLGIVGESGSGKSVTSLALMRLLPANAQVSAAAIRLSGRDLQALSEREMQAVRGSEMAMIFQDPMTSLNPSFTVEFQITEVLKQHGLGDVAAGSLRERAAELMAQVGIPDPKERLRNYSYQLSGGMAQRVMIAIAIACSPKLLIADEPTTALDVTIQAQILQLLRDLQKRRQMGLILITHDLGVVAEMADKIMVMYAGQVVEAAPTPSLLRAPRHPYTEGLLKCLPARKSLKDFRARLATIPGVVPDLLQRPQGCTLSPRCSYRTAECETGRPELKGDAQRRVRCIHPLSGEV